MGNNYFRNESNKKDSARYCLFRDCIIVVARWKDCPL
ncbi:hypothetical protein COLO4_32841 [Corchorus olitorius]|uniref:Uncharacterized protein n=1 Tax=Corchorus olitorius TaxID=93759 RepID=A0A1R3GXZ5_9ROSI|nr:hypothetical protein COLO4_32841 [Corchorus olitorius]